MRIQHNIMAMNSYRNYNNNTSALSRNLEKLSSGYRINRAGDDAAGLAISEKMRAQIAGLDQAQSNVKDGISLVKTAEGALQEVQDMMNRMVTLATQSANGTYDNDVDRKNLQKEVEALKEEIDRIADSANFNGTKLLDGSLASAAGSVTVGEAGSEIQTKVLSTNFTPVAAKGNSTEVTVADITNTFEAFEITYTNDKGETKTLTLAEGAVGTAGTANEGGDEFVTALNGGSTYTVSSTSGNAEEDLKELKDLFNIAADTTDKTKVTFTAKDAKGSAKVTSFKQVKNAALDAALSGLSSASSTATVTAAADAYYTVTMTGASDKITIGDKTYENSDAATNNTAALAAADLVKQLKADGYDVEVDATNTAMIKFNKASQLQEAQKGAQITNTTDDEWDVTAVDGTKATAEITMVKATADDMYTFTVNYINGEGKEVSKEISYQGDSDTTNGAKNTATNLANALKNDAELSELFKIDADAAGKVTLKSKGNGSTGAQVLSAATSDKAGFSAYAITEGLDAGKELKLATGETIDKGDTIEIDGKTYQFVDDANAKVDDGVTKVLIGDDDKSTYKNLAAALEKNGVKAELNAGGNGLRFADNVSTAGGKGGLQLQIGDTADKYNQLTVSIGNMHVDALGIGDLDISNQKDAAKAIDVIKAAINTVSSTRGDLGAIQNRLEHTTNNLAVMTENIQDAESTIRDVDIADEMTTYTKNNILLQSAQAMLAQANQMPQGVLQLLQ